MIERSDFPKDGDPEESVAIDAACLPATVNSNDHEKRVELLDNSNAKQELPTENQGAIDKEQDIDEIDDGGWLCL
jgi:hypothetical protein